MEDALAIVLRAQMEAYGPIGSCIEARLPDPLQCSVCDASAGNLRQCGGCHTLVYCSAECQTRDWPDHALECRLIRDRVHWDHPEVTVGEIVRHGRRIGLDADRDLLIEASLFETLRAGKNRVLKGGKRVVDQAKRVVERTAAAGKSPAAAISIHLRAFSNAVMDRSRLVRLKTIQKIDGLDGDISALDAKIDVLRRKIAEATPDLQSDTLKRMLSNFKEGQYKTPSALVLDVLKRFSDTTVKMATIPVGRQSITDESKKTVQRLSSAWATVYYMASFQNSPALEALRIPEKTSMEVLMDLSLVTRNILLNREFQSLLMDGAVYRYQESLERALREYMTCVLNHAAYQAEDKTETVDQDRKAMKSRRDQCLKKVDTAAEKIRSTLERETQSISFQVDDKDEDSEPIESILSDAEAKLKNFLGTPLIETRFEQFSKAVFRLATLKNPSTDIEKMRKNAEKAASAVVSETGAPDPLVDYLLMPEGEGKRAKKNNSNPPYKLPYHIERLLNKWIDLAESQAKRTLPQSVDTQIGELSKELGIHYMAFSLTPVKLKRFGLSLEEGDTARNILNTDGQDTNRRRQKFRKKFPVDSWIELAGSFESLIHCTLGHGKATSKRNQIDQCSREAGDLGAFVRRIVEGAANKRITGQIEEMDDE